jgi:hypothetical protein
MKVEVGNLSLEAFRDPVFVSEDWALPQELPPVRITLESGDRVELVVEVTRHRARARRVCVETDSPKGVGSAALRRVPVRNAMAIGCMESLLRITKSNGKFAFMPNDVRPKDLPVVKPLIEKLIGYERLRAEEGRP